MKNKIIKTVTGCLLIAGCVASGYCMGNQDSMGKDVSAAEWRDKPEEQQYDTDLIAIVNMDEGVHKADTLVSYSQALLGTLEVRHEVTGIEDAKQGLKNGKYSAYIILPGTFSKSVESINGTPQKAVLEYELATNLSEKAQAKAIYSVGETYLTLNRGVSEVYLSSVLEEVHKVQDSAAAIKENDLRDLNALEEINGNDLRESIQLADLETVDKQVEILDLAPHYEKSDQILTQIDESYQSAWGAGKEAYEEIKSSASQLEEKVEGENGTDKIYSDMIEKYGNPEILPDYQDEIGKEESRKFNEIKGTVSGDLELLAEGIANLETVKQQQETYSERAELIKENYQNMVQNLGTPDSSVDEGDFIRHQFLLYKSQDVNQKLAKTEADKLQYGNDRVDAYYYTVLESEALINRMDELYRALNVLDPNQVIPSTEEIKQELAQLLPQPGYDTVPIVDDIQLTELTADTYEYKNPVDEPDFSVVNLDKIDADGIAAAMDDLITASNEYTKTRNGKIQDNITARNNQNKSLVQDLGLFDSAYAQMAEAQGELNEKVQGYNPQSFLDPQNINGMKQSLAENENEIQKKIGNQEKQYEEYVQEVYKTAEENTKNQRESIEKGQKASDEKLDAGLGNAKGLKQSTYESNQYMLNEIGGLLPYTRLGSQENILAYRFMAQPLAANNLTSEKQTKAAKPEKTKETARQEKQQPEREKQEVSALVYVIPVLFVIAALVVVLTVRRRKSVRGQEKL